MWLNADVNVKDGFAAVKSAIESVYGCLGITCADVGGMLGDDGEYLAGFRAVRHDAGAAAERAAERAAGGWA